MRETLYIRLRSADPAAVTSYCIAGAHAVASFPVGEAPLAEILRDAGTRRIVALVPGADVRLASLQLPTRQAGKVLQAAPYALEEQLAEDVETLHFALGPRQADGHWPVAVAAHARMQEWLRPFLDQGLRPDAIVPETLCLPAVEPLRWSALAEPDQVSVRNGAYSGFACVAEDLALFMQVADPDKKAILRIIVPRHFSPDFTQLGWPVELLPGFSAPLEALLQNLRLESSINLLQGRYSQREDLRRLWLPWRVAGALAAAWLLLAAGLHGVEAFKLHRALTAQEARNLQRFREVFPSETRIVDLSAQLDQQMAALKGGRAKGALLPLLDILSAAMRSAPGLAVQTLQYREGALYVGLSGSDLQMLENLRSWFSSQPAAALEVQSANSGAEGVQIRIKITPA